MTTPLSRNYSMWGMPPTIAKRYEPTSDVVSLVMWNLTLEKGITLRTSRPYVTFVDICQKAVTGISAAALNEALTNLTLCGTCVVFRADMTKFMFYLDYDGAPDSPVDKYYEVDPKQAIKWPEDFTKFGAIVTSGEIDETIAPVDSTKDIPL